MQRQRVVVTGMGAVSPYGEGVVPLWDGLAQGKCALQPFDAQSVNGLECAVCGVVPPVESKRISREVRRTMSSMSVHACLAAKEALAQAGIDSNNMPRMGIAISSSLGSPDALHHFFSEFIHTGGVDSVRSTTFFKVMGHSIASNVAMALGITGRLLAPAAACASALTSIGLAYESICLGKERIMLCGGADEFHPLTVATFDRMQAASHCTNPAQASLPFDKRRSGIVISEGAGILVLENLEAALARNAPILAEICGYASITSPQSIVFPDTDSVYQCMAEALADAHLAPPTISFVNAHATATLAGDVAEGTAIDRLWGPQNVPVNSLKGHIGHSLGASGALESIACVMMLRQNSLLPTLNLQQPDSVCGTLDHITTPRRTAARCCIKNAFALGGVYCSLVLATYETTHKN